MTEESAGVMDESYDSYDDAYDRPLERWAPLGAANASPPMSCSESSHHMESDRLNKLEEEQEQLNSSLFALTTHFAQVQFRLKQIVDAPTEHKEALLKELEEFAFKGIPDARSYTSFCDSETDLSEKDHGDKMAEQRKKQTELIQQLKSQLEDLETFAYETGDADMPTSQVMEKQKVVIDQLRNNLDLHDLEHFDKLSSEELRQAVDKAIGQIVNPAKVKEKLVDQLKTQIVDLERFIQFLQGESQGNGVSGDKQCTCPLHEPTDGSKKQQSDKKKEKAKSALDQPQSFREQTLSIMRHALTLLQIFVITQFGCGGKDFQKNLLKRTTKGNHWGDLRARLEMAISRVVELGEELELDKEKPENHYCTSPDDMDDPFPLVHCDLELVTTVRKDLAVALRDLLQHGLYEVGQSQSLIPFGCLPSRSTSGLPQMMHAWDLFLKYYETKNGKEYNEEPARRLSMAFGLEVVGGKAVTARQTLLSAIEEVTSTHQPLRRSEDSQFKAFVCLGLNQKKLVTWLRILVRSTNLIEYYYQPWSYVVRTGFDDSLASLERLMKLNFDLPTDLAIRPFHNIKDAF